MPGASVRVFRDRGTGRSETETAPAGLLLVFAFGDPYRVGAGPDDLVTATGGFVIGAQSRCGSSALRGASEGVQVELPWSMAVAVLPELADLADRAVRIGDLDGGAALIDQLTETPVDDRVGVVGAWLRSRRESHREPPATLIRALTLIEDGTQSVAGLAAESGCSRGYLHRTVRAATGQAPSTLIRVARLHRLIRGVATGPHPGSLAAAAARAGYTDHAHLCHESRLLAGRTPTELLPA